METLTICLNLVAILNEVTEFRLLGLYLAERSFGRWVKGMGRHSRCEENPPPQVRNFEK